MFSEFKVGWPGFISWMEGLGKKLESRQQEYFRMQNFE
jgi:hypothetical protein